MAAILIAFLFASSPGVDVVDVSGPLDPQAVAFIRASIEQAAELGRQLVVLQLDSPAAVGSYDDIIELARLIADPPVPVAVWIGPSPAVAFGGAFNLLRHAPIRAAAPGVHLGYSQPWVAGGSPVADSAILAEGEFVVEGPSAHLDLVQPTIRQLLSALDGRRVTIRGATRVLDTVAGDGTIAEVRFRKPGLWARFLRLGVRPEAAFFFLVAGLTVAAFEFYAVGPGLAAAVAGLSLFIGGYGLSVLPVRGWALVLTVLSMAILTRSFQRGTRAVLTGAGAVGLGGGGLWLVDGSPQLTIAWWGVVLTVAAALFFFLLAMPAVARSRFSTPTIGRLHLVGMHGLAVTDLNPDGTVDVAGARWPASAHREAGIRSGAQVSVVGVSGWSLQVEPAQKK